MQSFLLFALIARSKLLPPGLFFVLPALRALNLLIAAYAALLALQKHKTEKKPVVAARQKSAA